MKWMKAVLCGVLLGAAGTAASSDEAREQPLDYRQGLMLETSGASPWYRVELPPTIYQGTAWPDLRDVRVRERPYRSLFRRRRSSQRCLRRWRYVYSLCRCRWFRRGRRVVAA